MKRTSQNKSVGKGFPTKAKGTKTGANGKKLTGGKATVNGTRKSKWFGGNM
jgi:hypothetical protein